MGQEISSGTLSCGDLLLLTSGRGLDNYIEVHFGRLFWPMYQDGNP